MDSPVTGSYNLPALANLLGSVSHFKDLPASDRQTIVSAGQVRRFPVGSTIFVEGEPSAGMFVLIKGQVHLHKLGPQGQESIIAVIDPVIMFNEVTALDGGPNLTTALAAQECITWHVRPDRFQQIIERYPQAALGLLRVLAARNRVLLSQYEDLSFRSVMARVAKLLLDLSGNGQQPIDRREHSNHELAARIATVPEAFSRSLKFFRENGQIACTRTSIAIRQPDALAKHAQVAPNLFRG